MCMGDLGLGLSLLISEVRLEHKKRDPQQNLTYLLKYEQCIIPTLTLQMYKGPKDEKGHGCQILTFQNKSVYKINFGKSMSNSAKNNILSSKEKDSD